MTLEQLEALGCNVKEGLQRCMNNENFYLILVGKFISTTDLSKLKNALDSKDLETAFKEAHSLKGVCGNLSITPMFQVLAEMVEHLRNKEDIDYLPYYQKIENLFNQIKAL